MAYAYEHQRLAACSGLNKNGFIMKTDLHKKVCFAFSCQPYSILAKTNILYIIV